MPGHGHVTALIRTNKAYVTCLTIYLTVFFLFFINSNVYGFIRNGVSFS